MAAPLRRAFSVSSASELERELATTLRAEMRDLRATGNGIGAKADVAQGHSTEIWLCDYGVDVTLALPDSDYVRVQIPLSGTAVTTTDGTDSCVHGQKGCISSASAAIHFLPGFTQIAWRISRSELTRKLSALIGAPIVKPIEFAPELDLAGPQAGSLRPMMNCLFTSLSSGPAGLKAAQTAEIEQAMLTMLLGGALHNYRSEFEEKPAAAAPWQVKRVEEFIECNWNKALDFDVLAAATGTSVRSIFRTFRDFRGCTPMEYVKRIRLEKAMALLTSPHEEASVTDIAFHCGYSSLSAFTRDFSAAYGIPPSAARHAGR